MEFSDAQNSETEFLSNMTHMDLRKKCDILDQEQNINNRTCWIPSENIPRGNESLCKVKKKVRNCTHKKQFHTFIHLVAFQIVFTCRKPQLRFGYCTWGNTITNLNAITGQRLIKIMMQQNYSKSRCNRFIQMWTNICCWA